MVSLTLMMAIFLAAPTAYAWQDPPPPLTEETLVGTWEATPEDARLLYHIEINKKGDSYLALFFHPKSPYSSIFRLVSSEVKNGSVKLHFHLVSPKEDALTDLWIEGKGVGFGGESGEIIGTIADNGDNGEPDNKERIVLLKGNWTRRLAELSKKAEKAIKAQAKSIK
jgi:hypothetical protein